MPANSLTVVYNNLAADHRLAVDWGFACLVAAAGRRLLFDTGARGDLLLANLKKLGIDPLTIDAVFLSHEHWDHTGGLAALLAVNPRLTVILPTTFSAPFRRTLARHRLTVELVAAGGRELAPGFFSTGPLGREVPEQALGVVAADRLVMVTGCAHPGVVELGRQLLPVAGRPPTLVTGGFHLLAAPPPAVAAVSRGLEELGVQFLAPSHCSGEAAIALLRRQWGTRLLPGGCGAVLPV
ncbi:MAG: MBL fold metallo-hydrolase [Deltaproteobacteria bacterium]|nr:MBL fold metallo-hydrolase [Deltaproteobacteria bacterium]